MFSRLLIIYSRVLLQSDGNVPAFKESSPLKTNQSPLLLNKRTHFVWVSIQCPLLPTPDLIWGPSDARGPVSTSRVCNKCMQGTYARPVSGVLRLWDFVLREGEKRPSLFPEPVPTCICYTQPFSCEGKPALVIYLPSAVPS